MRKNKLALVALVPAFTVGVANAAAPDVTATVTAIGEAVAPIGLIGIATLAVIVAIKTYKWVRRAM